MNDIEKTYNTFKKPIWAVITIVAIWLFFALVLPTFVLFSAFVFGVVL